MFAFKPVTVLTVGALGAVRGVHNFFKRKKPRTSADGTTQDGGVPLVIIETLDVFNEVTSSADQVEAHSKGVVEVRLPGQGMALRYVPPLAMQLVALTTLDLSGCAITYIPSTITNLQDLRVLNLARCHMGALPPELDEVHALTQLDVSAQTPALVALPVKLAGLTNLTNLNAMGNALTHLPEDIGALTALRVLGLKSNRLTSLPASFTRLTNLVELFVTDNLLDSFPEGMGNLASLVKVQASFNRLTALPPDMLRLPRLEMLRVAVCNIAELPADLLSPLTWPNLAWFSLGGNPACAALPPSRPGLAVLPALGRPSGASRRAASDAIDDAMAESSPAASLPSSALLAKLGDGASGEVFLTTPAALGMPGAEDSDEKVAVKVFRADVSPDGRTDEEVGIACALDHPCLTRVRASLSRPLALVMDLVAGQPMAAKPTSQHLLRCKWPMDVRYSLHQILRVGHDVACALEYLHGLGVCHGDVYAHNILVDEETYHATLCDFGAAFSYDPSQTFWQAMEVRAYGLFLKDLAALLRVEATGTHSPTPLLEVVPDTTPVPSLTTASGATAASASGAAGQGAAAAAGQESAVDAMGPKQVVEAVRELAATCLEAQPTTRPTFAMICKTLTGLM